jgi:hypothetical protein
VDINLTTETDHRNRPSPYQLIRHYDGSVEIICCHRGGASRFFGDSEEETLGRVKSFLRNLKPNHTPRPHPETL